MEGRNNMEKLMKNKNMKIALILVVITAFAAFIYETGLSHDSGGITTNQSEHGSEGGENGEGSESGGEESGNTLTLSETYDVVRNGARLIMSYDKNTNSFKGTVENVTKNFLKQVRVEVHLSNGTELGPTTPVDLAPGKKVNVTLQATNKWFYGWTPHAEVGGGSGSGEHAGESGSEGSESGGEESGNTLTLSETYDVVRNGARLVMTYDKNTNSFKGTVENVTNNFLRRVRVEVHLSNGIELGPTTPVNLAPGKKVRVTLRATTKSFYGWTPHAEVGGGEAGEGGSESGESGSEHGSEGSESGGEHGSEGGN